MVGMLLGEPDVLMLFGAVGGVMAARFSTSLSLVLSAFCFDSEKDDLAVKVVGMQQAKGP
jgi:hypothetical protein